MSKRRNVAYIKPQEPEFLARLKREAGFIEGPTVDTKRETLPELSDDEDENRTDDSPVVVVLKPGDLTQEEAEEIKKKQESEQILIRVYVPKSQRRACVVWIMKEQSFMGDLPA
ncbi:hypothetical protein J6590_045099 [Homalodisca vitripennis]|nr:hypothetical protein J6590_045099 [Homalodisca vitripennis]